MSDAHPAMGRARMPRMTTISTSGGRVSIAVPASWETVELGPGGDVVAAVEPDDGCRFRTNFVLATPAADGPLPDWDAGDVLVLDREDVQVAGHPGTHRLTTHATPAEESVTTESWATVVDGRAVTLTANIGTLRVGELARLVDTVAASIAVRRREGVHA